MTLRVVENLSLQPSNDVYIMVHSYVDFVVERKRHGRTIGENSDAQMVDW